jgi:hypothetical protein
MFETLNTTGYNLHQLPNHPDRWMIDTNTNEPYTGNMKQVVVYMIKNLGFHIDEIEYGINLLADSVAKAHDTIHFGARKTVIYSFKKEDKYGRRAS